MKKSSLLMKIILQKQYLQKALKCQPGRFGFRDLVIQLKVEGSASAFNIENAS
jgi:hypothetical protein